MQPRAGVDGTTNLLESSVSEFHNTNSSNQISETKTDTLEEVGEVVQFLDVINEARPIEAVATTCEADGKEPSRDSLAIQTMKPKRNRKRKRGASQLVSESSNPPSLNNSGSVSKRRRRRRKRKPEVPPLFPELLKDLPGLPQSVTKNMKEPMDRQTNPGRRNGPEDLVGKVKRRVFDEDGNVAEIQYYTEEELNCYGILLNYNGKRSFTGDNRKRNKFFKSQGSCGVTGILSSVNPTEDEEEESISDDALPSTEEPSHTNEATYEDIMKQRRVERAQKRRQESVNRINRRPLIPQTREKSCYVTQIRTTDENISMFSQYSLMDLYENGVFDIQTGQPSVKPTSSECPSPPISSPSPTIPSVDNEKPSNSSPLEQRVPLTRHPQSGDKLVFKILELNMEIFQPQLSDFKMFLVHNFDEQENRIEGIFLAELENFIDVQDKDDSSIEKVVLNCEELLEVHLLIVS